VRPYPERVAGDLIAFAYDESSGAFTARFRPGATGAPTELIAPARAYPTGFVVDCGGCDSVIDGDVVTLVTAPPLVGDEATVTIRPAP
jgi:hypothetical protein